MHDSPEPGSACDGVGRSWRLDQHVLASGVVDPAWPPFGLPLAGSYSIGGPSFAMVGDGSNGALVAMGVGGTGLSVQHVLAGGAVDPAWPNAGLFLAGSAGTFLP